MIGTWITLGDPAISEILALNDWNFIVVDMQHSMISDEQMQTHVRNILAGRARPFVRVKENTPANIGRALDTGAQGLIIPQVNNAGAANRAVRASRYDQGRGMGLWRSNAYGKLIQTRDPQIIVQIEHMEAVDNIEAIMAIEGVDGFLIGMYDLSASLNIPGGFGKPQFQEYMTRIDDFAIDSDKLAGIHIPLPEDYIKAGEYLDNGYFVVLGMDTSFLWQGVEHYREALDERGDNYSA